MKPPATRVGASPLVRASDRTGASPLLFAANASSSSPFRLGFTEADARAQQEGGGADHSPIWSDEEEEDAEFDRGINADFSYNSPKASKQSSAQQSPSPELISPSNYTQRAAASQSYRMPPVSSPENTPSPSPSGKDLLLTPRSLANASVPATALSSASKKAGSPATAAMLPPYKCGACDATFSAKGSLVRHEATHPALAQARLDAEPQPNPTAPSSASKSAQQQQVAPFAFTSPVPIGDVARKAASPDGNKAFPAFSPSEVRPYSSPSPSSTSATPATASASAAFPPFTPSEIRPLGSPPTASTQSSNVFTFPTAQAAATAAASSARFPPFSPSELVSPVASASAAAPNGFSPSHAHWSAHTEYDESYEIEGSDDGRSVQGSPRQPPKAASAQQSGSPPRAQTAPRIQMSPATRAASDVLVPSLSWLLILSRKLVLNGAVTAAQGRHIKRAILSGDPRLLSAVERFISREDQNAIVEALMSCLPDEDFTDSTETARKQEEERKRAQDRAQEEDRRRVQAQAQAQSKQQPRRTTQVADSSDEEYQPSESNEDDKEEEDQEDEESDEEYAAILGRGPGGHKDRHSPLKSRADSYRDMAAESSPNDSDEAQDDEENPLVVANSLLPLSLPQLESLHDLLRELGFHLIDLETLALCTSSLLPSTPRHQGAGLAAKAAQQVQPVTMAAWQSCIKSLRLHSNSPRLFTQLLTALYRVLDLNQTSSVPYGELLSACAIFCRAASHRQRLQFIFGAMQKSLASEAAAADASAEAGPVSSPTSPREPDAVSLPATAVYGLLFSCSLALHIFLAAADLQLAAGEGEPASLTDAQVESIVASVGVGNDRIWTLCNNLFALFDHQFGNAASGSAAAGRKKRSGAESPEEEEDDDEEGEEDDEVDVPDVSYAKFLTWRWHPSYVLDSLLQ